MIKLFSICLSLLFFTLPELVSASSLATETPLNLTHSSVGYFSLIVFLSAYLLVILEEFTHLRKSKPVMLSAGLIWIAIAWAYGGHSELPAEAARHNLLEYAELFLFLLAAMTYVNALEERQVFDALRSWLIRKGFNLRQIFWLTGVMAFFISPVADNLTTALLMCAVILAVGRNTSGFIAVACINVVVAANAGGAFSPFGDITTLMVWQKGKVEFWDFFALFLPSVVNWFIPALLMSLTVPKTIPQTTDTQAVKMKRGALIILALFIFTIALAVSFHNSLHLPPVLGMFTGLALLQFYAYYLKKTHRRKPIESINPVDATMEHVRTSTGHGFDIFDKIARSEWDTLLFFYGVIMCVGGLGFIGYLELASQASYVQLGATYANIAVGLLSSVVDNIPVMFAVLTMNPQMAEGQWLLVTLTAGVGGSLLSIGSAAGVALMGQARGHYTFMSHLKWTPAIALGYFASIGVHMLLNRSLF
ncbi:MAG TPA: sodium:proton antiporter NhaD [Thiolinea sp.]|nr:sodium:proton antiporter NhaD [Thiolinea sp.]